MKNDDGGRVRRRRSRRRLAGTLVPALTVSSAVSAGPAPADPGIRFRSPVPGVAVAVTPFDPPDQRWLAGHRGVDLAAAPLAPVSAPAEATVRFAGSVAGKPVVSLEHAGGVRTTYEPVVAVVRPGQAVIAGQRLGTLVAGHPGCPVEACLHWGARIAAGQEDDDDDTYVDPMTFLHPDLRPIGLKPTRPGDGAR